MKVVILNWRSIKDPLSGGAEHSTFELAKRWHKLYRAEIIWISAKYRKNLSYEEGDGIKFVYLGVPLNKSNLIFAFPYFLFLSVLYYLRNLKNKCDIVIDQVHGIPFFTPLYVKEKKIVFIHEVAGEIWDKMFKFPVNIIGRFFENYIFSKIYKNTKFITISESTKEGLKKIGVSETNISVVLAHGVNIKTLETPTEKYSNFTLLYLNRVVKMKGPERAIKIFSELKKYISDSKMIVIGRGDESYIEGLKILAKGLGVLNDIEFKGFVSLKEKVEFLQKSNVLINTSFKEGFGLVNIEANSQGTPVVAFDVDGCRESVKDGVSGYISVDENDFVNKIILIRNNPNLNKSAIDFSKQFNYDDKSVEFWKVINE